MPTFLSLRILKYPITCLKVMGVLTFSRNLVTSYSLTCDSLRCSSRRTFFNKLVEFFSLFLTCLTIQSWLALGFLVSLADFFLILLVLVGFLLLDREGLGGFSSTLRSFLRPPSSLEKCAYKVVRFWG